MFTIDFIDAMCRQRNVGSCSRRVFYTAYFIIIIIISVQKGDEEE